MTTGAGGQACDSVVEELDDVEIGWPRGSGPDLTRAESESRRYAALVTIADEIPACTRHQVQNDLDLARATRAVRDLLDALGLDCRDPNLAGTPARVARAYAELLSPEPFAVTTFPNDEGYDELVMVSNMAFSSLCEHHLLPFTGVAHVGYLPGGRLVGLSKLARAVTHFSRRLQVQERLTKQVADWLVATLQPSGVGVVIEAEHACMSVRGVRAAGSRTRTSALAGRVRDDASTRSEFFSLIGGQS
jgi:GTP cyclohydrolase IA